MSVKPPTITLNNGIHMPQLGLGVWQASDDETERAVSIALENGYRLIDTASVYGNEAAVGRAIAASGVKREELFITSKVWNSDQGYEKTIKAFEASLERLGLDYLDLYLIHWPMPKADRYIDTWHALEKLHGDGKIRAIGVSNFQPEHLERLIHDSAVVPAINQIEIHPDFQQRELRGICTELGIQAESWSPLGGAKGGLLTNPTLVAIAEKHGKSPAQIAIRWHIQNGLVVIPKSTDEQRIIENAQVFDFALDADDLAAIDGLDSPHNRHGPHPNSVNLAPNGWLTRLSLRLGLSW